MQACQKPLICPFAAEPGVCGTLLQDRERHGCRDRTPREGSTMWPEARYYMALAPTRMGKKGLNPYMIPWICYKARPFKTEGISPAIPGKRL